uniref:Uncharacterized protein n=1 Tax=Falco tinnunculus TaxID=100819 RepID=A0A8C4UVI9_FALTI
GFFILLLEYSYGRTVSSIHFFWGGGRGNKEKRLLIFLFLDLSSCLYSASPLCSTRVKYLVEGEMEKSLFGREDGRGRKIFKNSVPFSSVLYS